MQHEITQRELRNDSGEIMRGLDSGQSYIVTRNGVPVGELRPIKRRQFVDKSLAQAAFAHVRALDGIRFRADLDRIVSQEPDPRA